MSEPVILFVKPHAISAKDKKTLQTAGVIVVEVENVADVKLVRAHAEMSSTDLLSAAAKAIATSAYDDVRIKFARAICATLDHPPVSS